SCIPRNSPPQQTSSPYPSLTQVRVRRADGHTPALAPPPLTCKPCPRKGAPWPSAAGLVHRGRGDEGTDERAPSRARLDIEDLAWPRSARLGAGRARRGTP